MHSALADCTWGGRESPPLTRGGERRVPTMAVYVAYARRSLDKPFAALNAWTMEHAEALRAAQKAFDERHGSVSERRG